MKEDSKVYLVHKSKENGFERRYEWGSVGQLMDAEKLTFNDPVSIEFRKRFITGYCIETRLVEE